MAQSIIIEDDNGEPTIEETLEKKRKSNKQQIIEARKNREGGLKLQIFKPEEGCHLNMIVYGITDAGKTYLGGTALDCKVTAPVLFMDIDRGTLTLTGKNIDIIRPQNWKEVQEAYDFLRFENTKYKALIVDSLTELQNRLSLGSIMGELSEDDSYLDLGDSSLPVPRDYGKSHKHMRNTVRAFRDLAYLPEIERRVHIIMTAREKKDENRSYVLPDLPGKAGWEVGGHVDILGRLSVQNKQDENGKMRQIRHLLVSEYTDEQGFTYLAKNRSGKLGRQIWEPTVEKLTGIWMK